MMTYKAPYIDSTGFNMPTYQDIVDQLVADAQSIFGTDIYLGIDSQDYQWISAVANIIYDSFLTSQMAYNSRGPSTAIGSGLDIIVKMNGLKRKPPVFSTCIVTLTGTAKTTITNGIVKDVNGNSWTLPSPIILDSGGSAIVTATCQTAGPIGANPGDINQIMTPTYGWTSVTNTVYAIAGSYTETDAQLRARQAISTELPSLSILEGIEGAIDSVTGVGRYIVYENDTGSADSNGLPPHSITCVVENGSDNDVAKTIFDKKAPGVLTNGTTSVVVTDTYGVTTTINFDRPSYVDIDVVVNVKQLTGYTTDITSAIQSDIASFISSLGIGDNLLLSSIWGAALQANSVPSKPTFSITGLTAARHLGALLTSALASGTSYTSLSVSGLVQPISSGTNLVIGTGGTTQTVTTSAAVAVGDTSIPVNSFTASAAFAVNTPISFVQSTTDLTMAYNEVSRGNTSYITINVS